MRLLGSWIDPGEHIAKLTSVGQSSLFIGIGLANLSLGVIEEQFFHGQSHHSPRTAFVIQAYF